MGVLGSSVAEVTGGSCECCLLLFDCLCWAGVICLWSLGASLDDFAGMGEAGGCCWSCDCVSIVWLVLGCFGREPAYSTTLPTSRTRPTTYLTQDFHLLGVARFIGMDVSIFKTMKSLCCCIRASRPHVEPLVFT